MSYIGLVKYMQGLKDIQAAADRYLSADSDHPEDRAEARRRDERDIAIARQCGVSLEALVAERKRELAAALEARK